jgi:CTP:molybdopterin cytidylyltransferase MocA
MKDERGGHPLVLSADDVEGIRTASPDDPLRNLVKPFKFEVGDPHLHLNVDTSVDLIGLTDSLADL